MPMKHEFREELIEILSQRGRKGLAVTLIAQIVYNNHNSLFNQGQCFYDLRVRIQRYLWTQSQRKGTPFTHISRGIYALRRGYVHQTRLPL